MMEGCRSVINRVLEDVGLPLVICFVMLLLIVKLFCSPMFVLNFCGKENVENWWWSRRNKQNKE